MASLAEAPREIAELSDSKHAVDGWVRGSRPGTVAVRELLFASHVNSEIVAQVCFISNAACVDPEITGDELTQFVGSAIRHGHVSRAFAAPQRGPSSVCGML